MLNAFLSGIGSLERCDGNRHVPNNRQPLLLCLINDREVSIAWQTVVNFDAVRASLFEPVDCLPAFSSLGRRISPLELQPRAMSVTTSSLAPGCVMPRSKGQGLGPRMLLAGYSDGKNEFHSFDVQVALWQKRARPYSIIRMPVTNKSKLETM